MAGRQNRRGLRGTLREWSHELRGRRAGRKAMGPDHDLFTTARGIVGATGNSFSNAWKFLESDSGQYKASMEREPVLPPSLFVSERDRTRHGDPIPLVERSIEDVRNPDAMPVSDWDISELE